MGGPSEFVPGWVRIFSGDEVFPSFGGLGEFFHGLMPS